MGLSVIVPVYNEERSLLEVLKRLRRVEECGIKLEVIVVDDCSIDATRQIIDANRSLVDKIFYLERNHGKGKAISVGLGLASQELILIQDADLEYDPIEIPRLVEIAERYDLDLLVTSRFNGPEFTRVHYFWHKMGNRLITFIFNLLFNTTFTDLYSGYILFRRSLIVPGKLKIFGWGQQVELIATIVSKRGLIGETPVSYQGRTYDEGKKIRPKSVFGVVATIFWFRLKSVIQRAQ